MAAVISINAPQAIQSRLNDGRIPRFGPMLMLFARPALLLLTQGVFLQLFLQLNVPNAAVAVRNWWSVFGTLVDVGCLGLLFWLTKREGIRLRDLIGLTKSRLTTDIPLGLSIFLIVFPVTILGGGMLAAVITYGSPNPVFPEATYSRTLPVPAVLYSRLLWWPLWSATEEMTYNGYALPRLSAMVGSNWLSVTIVSFFFSIQHSFLSLAGFRYGFYMFLTFIPLTVTMCLIYLRIRRLAPLIIGHWLMDLSGVLLLLRAG
jgi:uncharacterized protein